MAAARCRIQSDAAVQCGTHLAADERCRIQFAAAERRRIQSAAAERCRNRCAGAKRRQLYARQLLDAEITARQLFEDGFPLQQMKARFGIAQLNGRWHQQVGTRFGRTQSQDPCGYRRREWQLEVPIEPRVGDYLKDSSA